MALFPTGFNKILEVHTSEIYVVIRTKKDWSGIHQKSISSIVVDGNCMKRIHIPAVEYDMEYSEAESGRLEITTPPIFFEQTDYEITVKSTNGGNVSFWNENYAIRNRIGTVIDGDDTLISGVMNFDNMAGYSELEIYLDDKRHLMIRVEVFPTKLTYKEDYQLMINDISEMACEAVIDFMRKTYQMFSLEENHSTVMAVYFQILSTIFQNFMNAVNRIIATPHHKLVTEHVVVPAYKAKKTDKALERWLMRYPEYVDCSGKKMSAEKVLAVKKQVTYDTSENRFVKFVLKSTIKKLEEFVKRYNRSTVQTEEKVLADADRMLRDVKRVLNMTFLQEVSEYWAVQSMSLVFGMAPGYRELYKCYVMLQRSLSVNGDVFKMSPKDTAQLYEYWCFIKLFSLLKKEYQLVSPDIIKVDNRGITVALLKGTMSTAKFMNPRTGELIKLIYNPEESKTQTVNQKPDNVLEVEKKGTNVTYQYIFDAKYRIEMNTESEFYPDGKPGPKVDDINIMHRYRDSIVYENTQSKFTFEKLMFGAYILFPLDGELEEQYKDHRFYKSIDTVNIGGLPFLPGTTRLVQKLLGELISDSKESAFERTTLPRGIEEKLATVDWDKRDVLIGGFGSREQFRICFEKKFYCVPAKQISEDRLPIHYVALYQTNKMFGEENGQIRYYGEAVRVALVRRECIKEIPVTRNNRDELYYKITVRQWKDITEINESKKPIRPKESGFVVDFTNMFLLEHSELVQELGFKSEAEYRFYTELKRSAKTAQIIEGETNGFEVGDIRFLFLEGEILAMKNGKTVAQKSLAEFEKKPAQTFRMLQEAVGNHRDLCSAANVRKEFNALEERLG